MPEEMVPDIQFDFRELVMLFRAVVSLGKGRWKSIFSAFHIESVIDIGARISGGCPTGDEIRSDELERNFLRGNNINDEGIVLIGSPSPSLAESTSVGTGKLTGSRTHEIAIVGDIRGVDETFVIIDKAVSIADFEAIESAPAIFRIVDGFTCAVEVVVDIIAEGIGVFNLAIEGRDVDIIKEQFPLWCFAIWDYDVIFFLVNAMDIFG